MNKGQRSVDAQNVGIDMASDSFDVNFMQRVDGRDVIRGTRKFSNTMKGFNALLSWSRKKAAPGVKLRFTMEATGVYHEGLAHFLSDEGCYVSVVLPNMANAYGKSLNIKSKNDKEDAKKMARMGIERKLTLFEPANPEMREMKKILRHRRALMNEKTMVTNQLHAENHSYKPDTWVTNHMKATIKHLSSQISEAEDRARDIVDADPEMKRRIGHVIKVRGLGFLSVATAVAETDGFSRITSMRQLTSFAGLDIVENQSGKREGKTRISKKGNSHIRAVLYMPAICTVQWEREFEDFYERIAENTGVSKKAYVSVMRKLLGIIYTLYTKDMEFTTFFGTDKQGIVMKTRRQIKREKKKAEKKKAEKEKKVTMVDKKIAKAIKVV